MADSMEKLDPLSTGQIETLNRRIRARGGKPNRVGESIMLTSDYPKAMAEIAADEKQGDKELRNAKEAQFEAEHPDIGSNNYPVAAERLRNAANRLKDATRNLAGVTPGFKKVVKSNLVVLV